MNCVRAFLVLCPSCPPWGRVQHVQVGCECGGRAAVFGETAARGTLCFCSTLP